MNRERFFILLLILLAACKKPYNPKVINSPVSFLVVEGVINTNDDSMIKLSRTVNLTSKTTVNPVDNAQLTVEGDDNSRFFLVQVATGTYKLIGVRLDPAHKYRLDIVIDGKDYKSDFEQAKITPPIDSVGFTVVNNKLQLYVNTHDPNNNTRYYRFDYTETWQFHARYNSAYRSDGVSIVPRHIDPIKGIDETVYNCFASDSASSIILGSTAKLTQDVLFQAPITTVDATSEKIETRYSIVVHEYALSETGYKFWENLKKNTEQLGSIFDALPSETGGNVHNVNDPKEQVVGYIGVSTVQSKRIFIDNSQIPQTWLPIYPYDCGAPDSLYFSTPKTGINTVASTLIPGLEIPVSAIFSPGSPNPIGYTGSDLQCVDCTIRGTKKRPDFWIDK